MSLAMDRRVMHGGHRPGPCLLVHKVIMNDYILQVIWMQRIYAITPRRARKEIRHG